MLRRAASESAVVVNTSKNCDNAFDASAATASRRDERRAARGHCCSTTRRAGDADVSPTSSIATAHDGVDPSRRWGKIVDTTRINRGGSRRTVMIVGRTTANRAVMETKPCNSGVGQRIVHGVLWGRDVVMRSSMVFPGATYVDSSSLWRDGNWGGGGGGDPYTQLIFQIGLLATFAVEAGDKIATDGRSADMVRDTCGCGAGLSWGLRQWWRRR